MLDPKNLQKYTLFGGLSEEQIKKMIGLMVEETYTHGEVIIAEGTNNDKLCFITKGRVSITWKDKMLYDLAEGNTFGEMEVLDIMPCAATVKASGDVTLVSISNTSLREIYQGDMKSFTLLLMNLARDLSRRLRVANEIMLDGKIFDLYTSAIFSD